MPLYYFNVTGGGLFPGCNGHDLPDDDAAWSMAIASMGDLLKDVDGCRHDRFDTLTTVTDTSGRTLMTLRFEGRLREPRH